MRDYSLAGPDKDLLTLEEVLAELHVGEKQLKDLIAQRLFPPGMKFGPRAKPRWRGLDLACFLYMQGRMASTSGQEKSGEEEDEEKS